MSTIGHNSPPTIIGFEAHIEDLYAEAANFLDGAPIENDGQAEAVAKLLDDARKVRKDADAQRAAEKKPHDDAAAAVQALWKPVLAKADSIINCAKSAQTAWLLKKDAEQRAAAEAARIEAERLEREAREAWAASGNLDANRVAVAKVEAAQAAKRQAAKLDRAKAQAKGGERTVSLRSYWTAELVDPKLALQHYMRAQPEALKAWLQEQANKDVRAGDRSIEGFEIKEERRAA